MSDDALWVLDRWLPGTAWPRAAIVLLASALAIVTAVAFGIARFRPSLGSELPFTLLGAVVITLGVAAAAGAARGLSLAACLLLAVGPVAGFGAYLLGYALVFPPSTDSPTWLVFLAFAAGVLGYGLVATVVGRLVGRLLLDRPNGNT